MNGLPESYPAVRSVFSEAKARSPVFKNTVIQPESYIFPARSGIKSCNDSIYRVVATFI